MTNGKQQSTRSVAESTLETLPLHSTDLLTLLDEQGVVHYESPAIERLYGYDQDELVGEQVAEYFHPEDRDHVIAAFRAVVEGDSYHTESVEYRHRMADDSYRWIESVASSNPTPEGLYVVNSRDISDRKKRERELQRTKQQVLDERDGKEAIRQLLLQTATGFEIADSVCRLLVETYGYEAAWVVHTHNGDSEDDSEVVRLGSHGIDYGFQLTEDGSTGTVEEATRRVLETDEPVSVTTDTDCGLYSVRSVPLAHDGVSYGALTAIRGDTGSEFSQQLVEEIAAALAFKQQISHQREALVAERLIELAIRIPAGHVLSALSTAPSLPEESNLSAEELQCNYEGMATYVVTTSAVDGPTLESAAAELPMTREAALLTESDTTAVVRIRVDGPSIGRLLSGYGGVMQSMVARDGDLKLTVQFPRRTNVSRVVETVQNRWPEATLQARTERVVDRNRPAVFEGLTRKQEDALRSATMAGFFDRPQGASADEIAETLGVSQSTFLHHLRAAERKVFGDTFGGDGDE